MPMTPTLIVRETATKGEGIFSISAIPKGRTVYRFIGWKRTDEETPYSDDPLQIASSMWLDMCGTIGVKFNHSCDPNCRVVLQNSQASLVALEDVPGGSELTFDYSTTCSERNWSMRCECGAMGCRKEILRFAKLPIDLRNHYLGLNAVLWFALADQI